MIRNFKDIIAWQKSHELTLRVYKATESFPKSEEFGLKSQMRKCVVSCPSNIVEGFKRNHNRDSVHFYNIAQASLEELKYQLLLSKDLKLIPENEYANLIELSESVSKLLYRWIQSHKK